MIEILNKSVTTTTEWSFYGELSEFESYSEFLIHLRNAKEGDKVILHINSTGGRCDIGRTIISAMKNTKAKVHCHVESPSYSMGAIIAVCGHSLTMEPNSYIMFHAYSGGYYGKGSDTVKQVQFENEHLTRSFGEWCTPFLTKKELDAIMAGDDLYIKDNDGSLSSRCKRHFKSK